MKLNFVFWKFYSSVCLNNFIQKYINKVKHTNRKKFSAGQTCTFVAQVNSISSQSSHTQITQKYMNTSSFDV
jgi:hypothetical protein